MTGQIKIAIQALANRLGYQIRRVDNNVSYIDPYSEQVRLIGKKIQTIFEVGAANGRDSVRYCELFPSAQVYAFEPLPESFAKIEKHVATYSRIVPLNMALSDQSGEAKFNISNWVDASSLLHPKITDSTFDAYAAASRSIQVKVDTVDHICELYNVRHINILKMDAQGAELDILSGASNMLSKGGIDLVFTEINFLEIYEGAARYDRLMSLLIENDFRLHNLYNLIHNQKGELAWGDAIFVHSRITR